jgi:chromate transporter
VVGVVLNLAVWFAIRTLFGKPGELGTIDVMSALITIGAFLAMFRLKFGMIQTLACSVLVGATYYLVIRT